MIEIYARQVELKSSIEAFNNAISSLELKTMELIDVIQDSGAHVSNNQEFLDWIRTATDALADNGEASNELPEN